MADRYSELRRLRPPAAPSSSGSACPTRRGCAATARRPAARTARPCSAPRPAAGCAEPRRASCSTPPASSCATRPPTGRRAPASRALVFDATGITDSDRPARALRLLPPAGPLAAPERPGDRARHAARGGGDAAEATAQRALEGFVRSVGKELGRGTTAQLVYVAPGAEGSVESTLRFLLSGRSAYVYGQVIRVGAGAAGAPDDWDRPLDGKVALVTGAARGIGAAIARRARPRRRARRLPRRPAAGRGARRGRQRGRRHRAAARHHRAGRAGAGSPSTCASGTAASTWSCTTPGITRDKTLGRMDARTSGTRCSRSTSPARSGSTTRCSTRTLIRERRPDRLRLLDRRHRRQPRPDQLRDHQGGRDRPGRRARAGARRARASRSTRSRPGFIETKMTAAMPWSRARRAGG